MSYTAGIDRLEQEPHLCRGIGRAGLIAHHASRTASGPSSPHHLRNLGVDIAALFAPEHGYEGTLAAGEHVEHQQEAALGIPVYSLYGEQRAPSPAQLAELDTLIYDLQDIGVRCYTYVSTLRHALEAAAEAECRFMVLDRAVPTYGMVDGPAHQPGFTGFVNAVPAPLVYGMTPGETARWLCQTLSLDLDLTVVPAQHPSAFRRDHWIAPSPAMRHWQTAWVYPALVWCEALPVFDCGRFSAEPFQVLGHPEINGWEQFPDTCCGFTLTPCVYTGKGGLYDGRELRGVRIHPVEGVACRPAELAVHLLCTVRHELDMSTLWDQGRRSFFDQLMGSADLRHAWESGAAPLDIIAGWQPGLLRFKEQTEPWRLYP